MEIAPRLVETEPKSAQMAPKPPGSIERNGQRSASNSENPILSRGLEPGVRQNTKVRPVNKVDGNQRVSVEEWIMHDCPRTPCDLGFSMRDVVQVRPRIPAQREPCSRHEHTLMLDRSSFSDISNGGKEFSPRDQIPREPPMALGTSIRVLLAWTCALCPFCPNPLRGDISCGQHVFVGWGRGDPRSDLHEITGKFASTSSGRGEASRDADLFGAAHVRSDKSEVRKGPRRGREGRQGRRRQRAGSEGRRQERRGERDPHPGARPSPRECANGPGVARARRATENAKRRAQERGEGKEAARRRGEAE